MDNLKLLRWLSPAFFLTVLNEKGEAAPKRSCVLMEGPRITLSFASASSRCTVTAVSGVVARSGTRNIGRGVSSDTCDSAGMVAGDNAGNVLCWNSS
jgi:hypothetical protein